jgi:hypothetical protein
MPAMPETNGGQVKTQKQAERASEVMKALHKFRDKLRAELPGLRRIEVDLTFEDGKYTQRIKLEAR